MPRKSPSFRSSKMLKKRLNLLSSFLDASPDGDNCGEEFSSLAIGVVQLINIAARELEIGSSDQVSKFGMALLSLDLGHPSQASFWWREDVKQSQAEGDEIRSSDRDFLEEKFQEIRRNWLLHEKI